MPTLLKYDEERGKMHRLEQEVLKLKEQVLSLAEEVGNLKQQKSKLEQELGESHTSRSDTVEEDDTDEFCVISRYYNDNENNDDYYSNDYSKLLKHGAIQLNTIISFSANYGW